MALRAVSRYEPLGLPCREGWRSSYLLSWGKSSSQAPGRMRVGKSLFTKMYINESTLGLELAHPGSGSLLQFSVSPSLSFPSCNMWSAVRGAGALGSLLEVRVGLVHTRVSGVQALCLPYRRRRCVGT